MRRNAFTLAEVLITLGIIGVVAAMTMPTLMGSTQEAQYKTAFKKEMSSISQAIKIAAAKNGEHLSSATKNLTTATAAETVTGSVVNVLAEGLSRQNSSLVASSMTGQPTGYNTFFQLADGAIIYAKSGDGECTAGSPCSLIIDTNGTKGPNKTNVSQWASSSPTVGGCSAVATSGTSYKKDAITGVDIGDTQAQYPCVTSKVISDQFKVHIYDDKIIPADSLGLYVFYGPNK